MKDVMLAVLAGGEGSRMGRPKGELRVAGKPILEYLLRRWDWPGEKVLVTAPGREHPPGWEIFDREVRDAASGEGPLRGVLTALENCGEAEIVVVATCDMPLVTREMLEALVEAIARDAEFFAVLMRRSATIEPFPLALRPGAAETLRARLRRAERSVRAIAELDQFTCIDGPDDPSVWTNLNRPEDYARFAARAL